MIALKRNWRKSKQARSEEINNSIRINEMNTVLLAQGTQSDLSELYDVLVENHLRCLSTLSVIKAIESLSNNPTIDLVLASISMQMRSGLDILQHVKKDQKLFYIPVIMTADEIDHETALKCFNLGANDIITKPFAADTVMEKIHKLLTMKKPTVLIVDDEKEILDLLKQVVELENFKVITSLKVEDALQSVEENRIDAIISDINFPGMTGIDLLETVKKNHDDIPVILITGYSNRYTPKFAVEAGADGFFNKPFKNTDLIRKLKQLMPNHFQRTCLHLD